MKTQEQINEFCTLIESWGAKFQKLAEDLQNLPITSSDLQLKIKEVQGKVDYFDNILEQVQTTVREATRDLRFAIIKKHNEVNDVVKKQSQDIQERILAFQRRFQLRFLNETYNTVSHIVKSRIAFWTDASKIDIFKSWVDAEIIKPLPSEVVKEIESRLQSENIDNTDIMKVYLCGFNENVKRKFYWIPIELMNVVKKNVGTSEYPSTIELILSIIETEYNKLKTNYKA